MSDVDFPSKEAADNLTLNELMQAIAMAGLRPKIEISRVVRIPSGVHHVLYIAIVADYAGCGICGRSELTPRAALDSACEAWRKEAE